MRLVFLFCLFNGFLFSQSNFSGEIVDLVTKVPIPFCKLKCSTMDSLVESDENGHFQLAFSSLPCKVIFYHEAYFTDTVELQANSSSKQFWLNPLERNLDMVVISGATQATLLRENPLSITSITAKQLERVSESNIIDALVKFTLGMSAVKTGPNISKPFIHGLGYNRVLTLIDGVRQEGQQYGDEHGLEVDEYTIERAEVIKGPASLLYGSDAIAGVVSLFPYVPKHEDGRLHGCIISEYQTNNGLIGNSVRLEFSNKHFFGSYNASFRAAQNYRNSIDGRVYLTNFNILNQSLLVGVKSKQGVTRFGFTYFDNRQGIPDGSRDSVTRKFTKQLAEGVLDDVTTRPIVSSEELNSYHIPLLSQRIQHLRAYLQSNYNIKSGDIVALLGFQQNNRREFTHPTVPTLPGMYMRLNTLNYNFRYSNTQVANWVFSIGINGMLQQNTNKKATDFPLPNYVLADGGAYAFGKWKLKKWTLSGGLRYDVRQVNWNNFYVLNDSVFGFNTLSDANTPQAVLQYESFSKLFHGLSGSLGATVKIHPNISFKANVGRGYRAPNCTELGSNGLDPGAHIRYLGNRAFKPEFSLQEDLGMLFSFLDFSGEWSVFNNHIQHFIYMRMETNELGIPLEDAQGNKTYRYYQTKAQLMGFELLFSYHPQRVKGLKLTSSFNLVQGFNRDAMYRNKKQAGEYLPLIAPAQWNTTFQYDFRFKKQVFKSLMPQLEVEYTATQNRYLNVNQTETKTSDYTLLHAGIQSEWAWKSGRKLKVLVRATNLLNKAYQAHLSRLKYFEYYNQSTQNNPGIYNMGMNVSIKITFVF